MDEYYGKDQQYCIRYYTFGQVEAELWGWRKECGSEWQCYASGSTEACRAALRLLVQS